MSGCGGRSAACALHVPRLRPACALHILGACPSPAIYQLDCCLLTPPPTPHPSTPYPPPCACLPAVAVLEQQALKSSIDPLYRQVKSYICCRLSNGTHSVWAAWTVAGVLGFLLAVMCSVRIAHHTLSLRKHQVGWGWVARPVGSGWVARAGRELGGSWAGARRELGGS